MQNYRGMIETENKTVVTWYMSMIICHAHVQEHSLYMQMYVCAVSVEGGTCHSSDMFKA